MRTGLEPAHYNGESIVPYSYFGYRTVIVVSFFDVIELAVSYLVTYPRVELGTSAF